MSEIAGDVSRLLETANRIEREAEEAKRCALRIERLVENFINGATPQATTWDWHNARPTAPTAHNKGK